MKFSHPFDIVFSFLFLRKANLPAKTVWNLRKYRIFATRKMFTEVWKYNSANKKLDSGFDVQYKYWRNENTS